MDEMEELNFRTVRECLNRLDQIDAEAGIAALNAIEQRHLRLKFALERISLNIYGDIVPQVIAGEALSHDGRCDVG